ncbi:MAG: alpha-1,3-galactosidase, partial [Candidatus Amulumruptor sp.]|nr:alpha-1,3-galactosidase [Candidatus Amulumruptor sp.]
MIEIAAPTPGADMTAAIQRAIDSAAASGSGKVTIAMQPGAVYNISRTEATALIHYVSNTTTRQENPDPTKHFGLWLKGMKNVTIDGRGATLLTHGEMTAIGIDSCTNVVITNLNIDSADPS